MYSFIGIIHKILLLHFIYLQILPIVVQILEIGKVPFNSFPRAPFYNAGKG